MKLTFTMETDDHVDGKELEELMRYFVIGVRNEVKDMFLDKYWFMEINVNEKES